MSSQPGSLTFLLFPFLSEHFIKSLPEYHIVNPVQVDAGGHVLSYGLHQPVTSSRKKRAAGGSGDQLYYRISHEEKDLFFNLTVNWEFLSNGYVVEKRYGNLSHVKMVASSGQPCHLRGTVLQQGTTVGIGTAALSACQGLVSIWPFISLFCPMPYPVNPIVTGSQGTGHMLIEPCGGDSPGLQRSWEKVDADKIIYEVQRIRGDRGSEEAERTTWNKAGKTEVGLSWSLVSGEALRVTCLVDTLCLTLN